jgi:hypothetical protein
MCKAQIEAERASARSGDLIIAYTCSTAATSTLDTPISPSRSFVCPSRCAPASIVVSPSRKPKR